MTTDARVIGTDPSADLREAAGLARYAGDEIAALEPELTADIARAYALAARLEVLAGTLPLRDAQQAVIDAASLLADAYAPDDADANVVAYAIGEVMRTVGALRAVNTREGE